MFDIGWSEMMLIIIVMVIVIGPKDLPRVMRTAGQWIGRMRAVARHFQESLEQMAEQTGLEDARKEIEKATQLDVRQEIERTIDPEGELRGDLSIESPSAKPQDKAPAKPRDESAAASAPSVEGPSPQRASPSDAERLPDAREERKP